MNFDDDLEIKAYLEHAEREMLPKMKSSAMVIVLMDGEVNIKLCAEIGAAILLDKGDRRDEDGWFYRVPGARPREAAELDGDGMSRNQREVVAYGKTPEGQLLYDLTFVDRTDRWLARKHRIPVTEIRSLRELSALKRLRKQVLKDWGGRG